MVEWMNTVRPSLPTIPAECTLKSGEIIYVPAAYRHGVINTADSAGIAFQAPFDGDGALLDAEGV
jgi:quercetin dioxygenase-like cupin family protein